MNKYMLVIAFLALAQLVCGGDLPEAALPLTQATNATGIEGWNLTGEWTLDADGWAHDAFGPPILCSRSAGTAVYTGKQFDDFSLGVRVKPEPERYAWNTFVRFRVQPENPWQYYFIQRDRSGKIFFGLSKARKDQVILAKSTRAVPFGPTGWLWFRIEAEENTFRIFTSTDGLEYQKVIDTTDPDEAYRSGYFAMNSQVHTHFAFDPDPARGDLNRRRNQVWLEAVRPTGAFRADVGQPVMLRMEAETYAMQAFEDRFYLEADGQTIPLGSLRPGYNLLHFDLPVARGSEEIAAQVQLSRPSLLPFAEHAIQQETLTLSDPLTMDEPAPAPVSTKKPTVCAIPKARYREYLEQLYTGLDDNKRRATRVAWDMTLPAVFSELYETTEETRYLEILKSDYLDKWIENYRRDGTLPDAGFPGRGPLAKAAILLFDKGHLTTVQEETLRAICSDMLAYGIYEGGGSMNRPLGYLLGVRPLLNLCPDHPLRRELIGYAENAEKSVLHYLEELENSTNYQGITLFFLCHWIELHGREDLYQDPKLKNSLERMLHMQSPIGGMAPYGDYGNVDHPDPHLLPVLEKAATVYRDGRFKTAAARLYKQIQENHESLNGWLLWGLSSAYVWADDSVEPEPGPSQSIVTYRNDGDVDKVILRNANTYVLFDMINGREHGDNNTLGLMAYVQNNQYRLFDQGGRLPDTHSRTAIVENAEDFPFKTRRYTTCNPAEPGRWALAELYLKNHWSWMNFSGGTGGPTQYNGLFTSDRHTDIPYAFTYYPETEFAFVATFEGSGKNTVQIDDVQLIDAEGNEMPLADFEENTWGWRGQVEQCNDGFESAHSARFALDLDNGFNTCGRVFQLPLDIDKGKWTKLAFRYKLVEPASSDFRLRLVTVGDLRGYPRNYLFHHNPMFTGDIEAFDAEANYVRMRLDERDLYGRPQSITREATLLEDGKLQIQDHLEIQASRPFACGPVFHVEKLLSHGEHWFETEADGRLLVWFAPQKGAVCGVASAIRSTNSRNRFNPLAVYQKSVGEGPDNIDWTMILVPLDEGADASSAALALDAQFKVGALTTE